MICFHVLPCSSLCIIVSLLVWLLPLYWLLPFACSLLECLPWTVWCLPTWTELYRALHSLLWKCIRSSVRFHTLPFPSQSRWRHTPLTVTCIVTCTVIAFSVLLVIHIAVTLMLNGGFIAADFADKQGDKSTTLESSLLLASWKFVALFRGLVTYLVYRHSWPGGESRL